MLTTVKLSGNYFETEGHRFIPVGVNWVPAKAAMQWPYEWDPASIEADFAKMNDLGINFLRFDLVWQWFEPRPGQFNEKAFEQFDFFIGLAHRYGIYLNPNFFIGGQVGDAYWDVPWRNGRHPHSDPEMLRLQARHVEKIASRYRGEPAIIFWDLTDEPPFWIVGDDTTDAMAANWTQLLCASLREVDPEHLIICGTAGQELGRGPFRADIILRWVDFLSVHPYPIYEPELYPEPLLSTRMTYSAAFETMLSLGAGKPVLMHEFGATSSQYDPERQARYYNTMMYSALAAGNQGFIAWCSTDADPHIQYNRAPYKRNPHETQFGITDYLGNDRPHGCEMRWISQVVAQMDLQGIEPAPLEAGIIVPHEWAHGPDYAQYGFAQDQLYQYSPGNILDYHTDHAANTSLMQSWLSTFIMCGQAGIHAGFPRELDDWSGLPLLLAPVPATNTYGYHLYVPFWQQVRPYVEAGGTLYASLSGLSALSIPDVVDLFGVSLTDRIPWQANVRLIFEKDFFSVHSGQTFEFTAPAGLQGMGALISVHGGEVIARDQDGNPALVLHNLGQGHTLICAYPLEQMLGLVPNAFADDSPYWRLYRALKELAGIRSPFDVEEPEVELGLLSGSDRHYVVLVNHSSRNVSGTVRGSLGKGQVRQLNPGGSEAIGEDESWHYELPGYSGVLFEWRRA
ncbi:MAG: cellulase family glycosylhydrolase [Anaerolineae bacterium]|nr:cellulase family glycosylhydrolase [Anaerolineae bacterium]